MSITTTTLIWRLPCPKIAGAFSDVRGMNSIIVEVIDMVGTMEEVLGMRTTVSVKSK